MSEEENIESFRQVIEEGYNKGDLAALDALFATSFKDHQDGISPPTMEGIKDFIKHVRMAFPDLKLTIEEIISVENKTWARTTAQGTHQGVFMGLPPTGKAFRISRFDVCRFEDRKIVEHWGVIDRLSVLQQLGATIQPAPENMTNRR
jgi:steroid delta-isomerase-like uncharacterized protein